MRPGIRSEADGASGECCRDKEEMRSLLSRQEVVQSRPLLPRSGVAVPVGATTLPAGLPPGLGLKPRPTGANLALEFGLVPRPTPGMLAGLPANGGLPGELSGPDERKGPDASANSVGNVAGTSSEGTASAIDGNRPLIAQLGEDPLDSGSSRHRVEPSVR